MKGCLRFNSGLEHKLPITQYNMETVVIESPFVRRQKWGDFFVKMSSMQDHFPENKNLHLRDRYVTREQRI